MRVRPREVSTSTYSAAASTAAVLAAMACASSGSGTSAPRLAEPAGAPAAPASDAVPIGLDASSLDASVAPCDDFYRHACGGWLDRAEIPKDYPIVDRSFIAMTRSTDEQLRALLEAGAAGQGPRDRASQLLGEMYGACTDEAAYQAGPALVREELKQLAAVRDSASLYRKVEALHQRGIHALFAFSSVVDPDDAKTYIAELDQGGFGLPTRDYYVSDDAKTRAIRDGYRAYIVRTLQLLGDSPVAAGKAADGAMFVETALAKAALGPVERRDAKRLKNRFKAGMAGARVVTALPGLFRDLLSAEAVPINIANPPTLAAVDSLVRSGAWPALRAYLGWRIVASEIDALPKAFRDSKFEFARLLVGAEQPPDRWRDCTGYAETLMRDEIGQAYIAQHFLPLAKTRAADMAKAIALRFRDNLQKLSWMDEPTRTRALEKLDAFVLRFGYPDMWRSSAGITLDRSQFLVSWRRLREREVQREDAKIGKSVDRREWSWPASMVNMGNSLELNALTFPAAVLQPPIFDVQAPPAVLYGSSGVFIGHEFTHGFDDQGRQYDAIGGTNPWWSEASNAAFHNRAACLVAQFDKERWLDDVPVNGSLSLGENIADLGGAKLAYAAAMATTDHAPSRYTPAQQFFLGYAQVWCAKYRPELVRMLAQSDPHAPPALRVNMVVRNMPEFQQAFSCSADSPMVRAPADRCEVW